MRRILHETATEIATRRDCEYETRRRDQEITETKPIDETRIGEKRDEGGVRFFIQVRFFIRRRERRRRAGQEVLLIHTHRP